MNETSKQPIVPVSGPGHAQWNAGGWLGASIGGTAWMIPTALILIGNGQMLLSLLPATCLLLSGAVAAALWARRDRLLPFRAYMILLGWLAVVTPLVWYVVAAAGTPEALAHMNWPKSPVADFGALLIAPAIMLLFLYLEYGHHDRPKTDRAR